jgi:CspA family cold shock protein
MAEPDRSSVLTNVEGAVKWFDPRKGFGFIIGPEEQDIFVHYSQIKGEGFRVLKDKARVRYSAELGEKGWHATAVERLDADDEEDHSDASDQRAGRGGSVRVRSVGPSPARNPRRGASRNG